MPTPPSKLPPLQPTLLRKGRHYAVVEVLPFIQPVKVKIDLDGDLVNVSSLRLQTFQKYGTACKHCGLEGTHFVKERHRNTDPFHLNLYGTDNHGREVLLTHDHIHPKSKGGEDSLSNTQPMCFPCNVLKGANVPEAANV